MIRIIDSRSSGKTMRLMLLAKENNGIIVCSNPYLMREKALRYGLTGIDFISYNDFIQSIETRNLIYLSTDSDGASVEEQCEIKGAFLDNDKPIYIDEIECLLNKLSLNKIMGYTLSNED